MSPEDEKRVVEIVTAAIERYDDMLREVVIQTLRDATKKSGKITGVRVDG